MLVRINKFLSDQGICSRREADEHILNMEIKINGVIAKPGDRIDPENDKIEFKSKQIVNENKDYVYYAFNKPRGIVSTREDELGRKNVADFVPQKPRVYPVGRLDKDSEGLIILTNDGEFTQQLTHPKFEHEKEYKVCLKKRNSNSQNTKDLHSLENKLMKGLLIDGIQMRMKKAKIKLPEYYTGPNQEIHSPELSNNYFILDAVLTTGHNRQIRKMCDRMGFKVVDLKRIRISKLKLKDLKLEPGEFKDIKKSDII